MSELQPATSDAVATLRRNLNCENAAAEIRAAQIIIEQSVKEVESIELQGRVGRLEMPGVTCVERRLIRKMKRKEG